MKKYNFDIETLKGITRHNIGAFDEVGCGMYNLNLCANERLSYRNEGGMVFQIYPFDDKANACYVLNYYEVSKDNYDHGDLDFFSDLEDWEQDIIFETICKSFGIDCKKYINPSYKMFNKLLRTISNADFGTLFDFIQSNEELKKIFDANFKIGYKWFASSKDCIYENESNEIFDTKEECYNDMRDAVLEKMKWNTEFAEDFESSKNKLESEPLSTNYDDVTIGYEVKFSPTKITHESYSGIYTYIMKRVFVDDEGKVLYAY